VCTLVGTGLVDFVGGMLAAVIAFVVLMRISTDADSLWLPAGLWIGLRSAFKTIRPIFKERSNT
jgi:subfamily B ATP-binding cassette protein MsbA